MNSNLNNISLPLAAGDTYTGGWEDITEYEVVNISIISDQNSNITVYFSSDRENADISEVQQYTTAGTGQNFQIIKKARYARIDIQNVSGSDQTYLRCYTEYKNFTQSSGSATSNVSDATTHTKLDTTNSSLSNIDSRTLTISTNTGTTATNTGTTATNTGTTATNTGTIATNTGTIATNTGTIATNTGTIETNTGTIATDTTNIDGKLTTHTYSGNEYVRVYDGSLGAQTSVQLNYINTMNSNINDVTRTEDFTAGTKAFQIAGRYDTTPRSVDDGDMVTMMMGEDGAPVTRVRCLNTALSDGVSNTKDLPISCSGSYTAYPTVGYMFNGTTWDRLRGSADNGLLVNPVNNLNVHRSNGRLYQATFAYETTTTGDIDLLSFHNPTGSGVTSYIYNISMSVTDDNAAANWTYLRCNKTSSAPTGGALYNPINLKFDSLNTSSVEVRLTPGTVAGTVNFDAIYITDPNTTSGFSKTVVRDYTKDWIEITENTGLYWTIVQNTSSSSGIEASITIRWVEI